MQLSTYIKAAALAFGLFVGTAQAATITKSFGYQSNLPGWILSDANDVSASIAGFSTFTNATLSLRLNGDFAEHDADVVFTMDGINFGTIFNENPGDDRWTHPTDASPGHDVDFSTSLSLTNAEIAAIFADGVVNISFFDTYPTSGDWVDWINALEYTLTFDTAATAVPEPGSLALLALGLAGLAAVRKRKQA